MVWPVSRKGDRWDTAPMQRFFATLKRELMEGVEFPTHDAARAGVFVYLEGFYNARRCIRRLAILTQRRRQQRSIPRLRPCDGVHEGGA